MQKSRKAYINWQYDQSDPNLSYDYVALLSTMQNQHFFTQNQNKMLLSWLLEAVAPGEEAPPE